MGDFSVPGLLISDVISGAVRRKHELDEADWQDEKDKRQRYVDHLGKLFEATPYGSTRQFIQEEIARIADLDRGKPFKPRSIPAPVELTPQIGTGGPQAGAGRGQPVTPSFDFRQVMQAITGQPAQPEQPAQPTQPTQPTQPGAALGQPGGQGWLQPDAPTTPTIGFTPQLVPPTSMSAALPSKAVTPPGKSVPEPSPLVGTLPGTPSPRPANTATPTTTPTASTTAMPTAGPSPITPFPGLVEMAALQGQADLARQKPILELLNQLGVTKSGQSVVPRLSVEDLREAADAKAALVQAQTDLARLRAAGLTPGTPQWKDAQRRADLAQERLEWAQFSSNRNYNLSRERFDFQREMGGSYIPLVDEYGTVLGAWNPRTDTTRESPIEGARKTAVPTAEREAMATADGMSTDLGRLNELLGEYSGRVGPVRGRVGTWESKITDVDPEYNEMLQITQSLQNRLIYLKSGKQINESEYERLRVTMPEMSQPAGKFLANLKRMQTEMDQVVARNAANTSAGRTLASHRWRKPPTTPAIGTTPTTPPGAKRKVIRYDNQGNRIQ